jgi:hypothetical protein
MMNDTRHRIPKTTLLVALTAAAFAASPAPGAPAKGGTEGIGASSETEPNDTFATRTILVGSGACHSRTFHSGKLGRLDVRIPDTMACFTGFAQEFCTAQNDDGGTYASYGGSAMFGLTSAGPFQLRVTGKGNPGFGNGVAHGQLGKFEVYITFYDGPGFFTGATKLTGELVTGDETILFSGIALAPGTATFRIIVNPLAGEQGDVDFYEFDGLRAGASYEVRIIGGLEDRVAPSRPLDTVMGEYTSAGVLTANINDDIAGAADRRSVLTFTADAFGRIFFAISGYDDFDFDGISDFQSVSSIPHPHTGQYMFSLAHLCSTGCADVDRDCDVDAADLAALLALWGTSCP